MLTTVLYSALLRSGPIWALGILCLYSRTMCQIKLAEESCTRSKILLESNFTFI